MKQTCNGLRKAATQSQLRTHDRILQSSSSSTTSCLSSYYNSIFNRQTVAFTTFHSNKMSKLSVIKAPTFQCNQKRSMFIQTASTPNPESIKFLPGRAVLGNPDNDNDTPTGFYVTTNDKTEIAKSPLCTMLFQKVEGIKSIYLGADFITVTKYAESNWSHLQTPIFAVIMDFYGNAAENGEDPQVLLSQPVITDTTILDTDDEVVAMIKELLETRIRPAVQEDGGDIHYVKFEEESGIVYVKLAGSCVGCPSSSVTLKNGVENMLMHYIPEVSGVEALMEESEEGEENKVEDEDAKKARTYEERLKAAGIPYSD